MALQSTEAGARKLKRKSGLDPSTWRMVLMRHAVARYHHDVRNKNLLDLSSAISHPEAHDIDQRTHQPLPFLLANEHRRRISGCSR
ncbi:hypothetical protein [Oryza sativa Japonica Group]|uniref:Uncharacterized protein n=1 Tax=Oryza sativa subsp. japonica TaxID=39947 RepID=Q5VQU4_ORYSJ|nr:hypothetical protein [Oryza sativa Japonica Group]BAD68181.1 hypothetical protein [Oryza sativa Japonica Group]